MGKVTKKQHKMAFFKIPGNYMLCYADSRNAARCDRISAFKVN